MAQKSQTSEHFWSKVNIRTPDECWEWLGSSRRKNGYGQVSWKGKTCASHRIAMWLSGGIDSIEISKNNAGENIHVLHRCDNKKCVNPAHLFLGDHQANMDDMMMKKRNTPTIGEINGKAKLTKKQVEEIRESYARRVEAGQKQKDMASEYGGTQTLISQIMSNKIWPVSGWKPKKQRHHMAKLTDDIVWAIRVRVADGQKQASMAREYGVKHSTISEIISNKTWKLDAGLQ